MAAAVLAVAACASVAGSSGPAVGSCASGETQRLAAVDWQRATTVKIRIRQDEYEPLIITLTQDRPYVLRFKNADDHAHVFEAADFFAAVALARVDRGNGEIDGRCISALTIGPGKTAELWLVPVRDGRYEFVDGSWWFVPSFLASGPTGAVYIEPAGGF